MACRLLNPLPDASERDNEEAGKERLKQNVQADDNSV